MKTTLLFIAGLFFMSLAYSQNGASDKIYDFLKEQEDVSLLTFSKDIIDMVDMNIGEDEEGKKVTGPLKEIRVAICKQINSKETGLKIEGFLKKAPFHEVDMEDEDNDLRVYIQRKGRIVNDCHVIIPGTDKLILVSFYGEFKIEDVDKLKESANNITWD